MRYSSLPRLTDKMQENRVLEELYKLQKQQSQLSTVNQSVSDDLMANLEDAELISMYNMQVS